MPRIPWLIWEMGTSVEEPNVSERERLWLALSDLFLDSENRGELPRLAFAALSSGFGWEVVDHIYLEEVAPVAGPNLLELAGEWGGFPPDWLFEQIRAGGTGTTSLSLQATEMVHDRWLVVSQLYHRLAEVPQEQQLQRSQSWLWLASMLLQKAWPDCHYFQKFLRLCLDPGVQDQLSTDFQWLETVYRPLWIHPGDPTDEQIRRNWRSCQQLMVWSSCSSNRLAPLLSELQILFMAPRLNPQHSAFPKIVEQFRLARVTPAQVSDWLQYSPWADWICLNEPGRSQWALRNWERNLLPII